MNVEPEQNRENPKAALNEKFDAAAASFDADIFIRQCGAGLDVFVEEKLKAYPEAANIPHNENPPFNVGFRPLHNAIFSNQVSTVKLLVKYGADIEGAKADGSTPLLWAVEKDRKEIVDFLLERGADIYAANDKGETAENLSRVLYGGKYAYIREVYEDYNMQKLQNSAKQRLQLTKPVAPVSASLKARLHQPPPSQP